MVDFAKAKKKPPLLELNLTSRPYNQVYYDEPIESREYEPIRDYTDHRFKQTELASYEQRLTNRLGSGSEKKMYLVKGLKQRENPATTKHADAYQSYFARKNQKEEQHKRHEHEKHENRDPSGRGSRLDELRSKLKSLESRSSSLSQRISTLMTERE